MPENRPSGDIREHLAAERTLLAYIRTSLAMMGFGFVVARFGLFLRVIDAQGSSVPVASAHVSSWFGTTLVVIGALTSALSAWTYRSEVARLNELSSGPYKPSRLAIFLSLALTCIGAAMAVYLVLTASLHTR